MIISVPATEGEIDGHYPTIDVAGGGTIDSPWNLTLNDEWTAAVVAELLALQDTKSGFEQATFTPTLTNVDLGSTGLRVNTATYVFVGGPDLGDVGVLSVVGRIQVGTIGLSVSGLISTGLPPGFEAHGVASPTVDYKVGSGTFLDQNTNDAPIAGGGLLAVNDVAWQSLDANRRWVDSSSTVPFTWGASDQLLYSYTLPAVRV